MFSADQSTLLIEYEMSRQHEPARSGLSFDPSEDQFNLLCSTLDEKNNSSKTRMRRSPAKANLVKTSVCLIEPSILSTAESHLTSRLKHVNRRELRACQPKANSSPRIHLLAASKDKQANQSMTFNVDYASTPKKNQPRASTPSRRAVTGVRTATSSTITRKTIPPPLLSSSMRPACPSTLVKKRKRCVECCCCSSDRVVRPASSSEVRKPRRRVSIDNNNNVMHSLKANSHLAKYPVRYMPNRRAQDIDRCDPVDEALISCDLRPFLRNCYAFGDYNVWII